VTWRLAIAAPARAQALRESVFADITSVMDFGILGALLASGLAGVQTWLESAAALVASRPWSAD